jgi:predicted neuraminidase
LAPGAGTPFVHAPTIAPLPSGELLVAWYGASGPRAYDAAVYGARGAGDRWSAPATWASTPGLPDANPVLFRDPQSGLWLFYATHLGGFSLSWLRYRRSADGGRTWGPSRTLTRIPGYLPRTKPIVLEDGAWVLPVYHEDLGSRFLRSADRGATWSWSRWVGSDRQNIQPAVVELGAGRLLALMRNRGPQGLAWEAWSADGGRTWDAPRLAGVRNPNASLDLIRLRDGALALVYNDSATDRNALAVAISRDQGRTWPAQILLEGCAGEFAETGDYPAAAEGPDGMLHVVYAVRGGAIKYARVDPARVERVGRPPQRCGGPGGRGG